jgi:hypothetical protein
MATGPKSSTHTEIGVRDRQAHFVFATAHQLHMGDGSELPYPGTQHLPERLTALDVRAPNE